MSGMLDRTIYVVTAPIRLIGRSRVFRYLLGAIFIVAGFFVAALWALDRFLPADNDAKRAVASLPAPPPLPATTQASYVVAPVAISINAIGRSLDASTPRDFSDKNSNPVSALLQQASIGLTVARGPMSVTGRAGELTVTTPVSGSVQVTGQIAAQLGNLTGALTGLLNGTIGKDVKNLTTTVLDQRADLRGNVIVRSRPALTERWRLEPRLAAQVVLSESAISIAGIKISTSGEAKPMIERPVNEQVALLEARVRNDTAIERAAREQWAKLCRAIPLGGGNTGLPPLWLEMRPVRASATQPQIDERDLTLNVAVQAESRIVATQTKPDCPFPEKLELVQTLERRQISVVVPIDVPFTALNKLLEAQLKGHRYPDDPNAPVEIEVRTASLAPAGDRLLISLRVKARERKSWFGFGAEANVHIWGKPALDPKTQMLRLTELTLAVESETAYGLLGAAAQAGIPYMQQALADNAVIDLKPFIADARAKIASALAEFTKDSGGVKVDAAVNELRLTGIAFDANTLRVIAEAEGAAKVAVTELPRM